MEETKATGKSKPSDRNPLRLSYGVMMFDLWRVRLRRCFWNMVSLDMVKMGDYRSSERIVGKQLVLQIFE